MELVPKEAIVLEDGLHKGVIDRVEYRTEPYKYTDIHIKEEKTELDLKLGCPTTGSMNSKLMKMLDRFEKIVPGKPIDPEKVLTGRQVQFMTMQIQKGDKTYAEIVNDSVKPLVVEQQTNIPL